MPLSMLKTLQNKKAKNMESITFDQLPTAVNNLAFEISEIKRILLQKEAPTQPEPEKLLTVPEAAKFLSLSVPTIYGKISRGELPFIKKSKRVYFSNIELLDYLKTGRKKSPPEIEKETDHFLGSEKKEVTGNGKRK